MATTFRWKYGDPGDRNGVFVRAFRHATAAMQFGLLGVVRENLSKRGSGRIYRIAKKKKGGKRRRRKTPKLDGNLRKQGFHRASAPGEPPSPDTGALRRAWRVEKIGARSEGPVSPGDEAFARDRSLIGMTLYTFGTRLPYARYLEYGTARVARRPYLSTAAVAFRENAVKVFAAANARALKRLMK